MESDVLISEVSIGTWVLCGLALLIGWRSFLRRAADSELDTVAWLGVVLHSWLFVASPLISVVGMLVDTLSDNGILH